MGMVLSLSRADISHCPSTKAPTTQLAKRNGSVTLLPSIIVKTKSDISWDHINKDSIVE
jgi:hypothetical protein